MIDEPMQTGKTIIYHQGNRWWCDDPVFEVTSRFWKSYTIHADKTYDLKRGFRTPYTPWGGDIHWIIYRITSPDGVFEVSSTWDWDASTRGYRLLTSFSLNDQIRNICWANAYVDLRAGADTNGPLIARLSDAWKDSDIANHIRYFGEVNAAVSPFEFALMVIAGDNGFAHHDHRHGYPQTATKEGDDRKRNT